MAKSCFNPEEAVALSVTAICKGIKTDNNRWQRMEQNERELTKRGQGEPVPQFLSTHPSVSRGTCKSCILTDAPQSYNRIAKIQEWSDLHHPQSVSANVNRLPEAQRISEQGDCHNLGEYGRSFLVHLYRPVLLI